MSSKKTPEQCAHRSVNRILDRWHCNDCMAEFTPVNPKHKTKWSAERNNK